MDKAEGWKRYIGITLGTVVLLAVLFQMVSFRDVPPRVKSLGAGYAKVFQSPDSVEVYQLVANPPDSYGRSLPMVVVGPQNLGEKVVPSASWIRAFKSWTRVKASSAVTACEPDPGFDVRFTRGSRSLDFLICLKCGKLAATPTGAQARGWGQFGDARSIVLLLDQLYPKDPDLSDLASAFRDHH